MKNTSWLSTDPTDSARRALQALHLSYGLTQHVNFPTHVAGGILNSCIDLVAASDTLHPTSVHPLPPLCNSDHLAIIGILELPTRPTPIIAAVKPRSCTWCWHTDRETELNSALGVTHLLPPGPLESTSTDDLWQHWRTNLLNTAQRFCTKT